MNGDGKPDLLAGYTRGVPFYQGRFVQVLIGNGDGTFRDEAAKRLPKQDDGLAWPYAIRVADFNGDGHLDFIVVVNGDPDERGPLYLDDGAGVYHPVTVFSQAWLLGIVDANGDGRPDLYSTAGGNTEQHFLQLQLPALAAPAGLRARGLLNGVRLTWRPVPGATAFEVWRAAARQARRLIGHTFVPSYDDSDAKRGVTYTYVVRAISGTAKGPFTAPVRGKRR